jgi:N-acylneuraminate cytidylyltransferase
MNPSVGIFLPIRKGSERVIDKNTKRFSSFPGGILELKLRQLIKTTMFADIVLSTNDEKAIDVALGVDPEQSKIRIVQRPDDLCLSTTPLTELIKYVPKIMNTEYILWTHATTPFVDEKDYDKSLDKFFQSQENGFDSLIGVSRLQNFIFTKDGKPFNFLRSGSHWPRTQDLEPLYEVNHSLFITSRSIYEEDGNRIGISPYLYELSTIKSLDIDWEEDFQIAEAIYDNFLKKKIHDEL